MTDRNDQDAESAAFDLLCAYWKASETDDRDGRRAAEEALIARGADAALPVVRELLDEESPMPWHITSGLLRRIGPPALPAALAGVITAKTEEQRRRAAFTFARFGTPALDGYIEVLEHAEPRVREAAATGIQLCHADGLRAAPALAALMADPDPYVRQRACWVLEMMGGPVVPLMQRIRLEGPGELRSGALQVLAGAGGEAAVSARDAAAFDRLIRIELLDDRPVPFESCWLGWIAVRGGDQPGILDAMGLTASRPLTFRRAALLVGADSHEGVTDRVFVTPELSGWTLVIGHRSCPVSQDTHAEVLDLCERLSARYGEAHAYAQSTRGEGHGWLIARHGTVLRRRAALPEPDDGLDGPDDLGTPLPGEAHTVDAAYDTAAALSVNPNALGPGTPFRGTGLIAVTPG